MKPEDSKLKERGNGRDHQNPGDTIRMEVATPNGVYRGSFHKTTKVEEVIRVIVEDRDLAQGDAFQLYYGEVLLEPVQRPLASFHLPHKVRLSLVATGSGV